jgi:hypothetical protein
VAVLDGQNWDNQVRGHWNDGNSMGEKIAVPLISVASSGLGSLTMALHDLPLLRWNLSCAFSEQGLWVALVALVNHHVRYKDGDNSK